MEYLKFIKNPAIKNFFWKLKKCLLYFKTKEKKVSCGNAHPDKTFYVISINWTIPAGLFAVLKDVLSHIEYAVERNMIPIVNMHNSKNAAAFQGFSTTEEPWESLFEQPMSYGLNDIKNSKNITLSCKNPHSKEKYAIGIRIMENKERLLSTSKLFKKYIRPNSPIQDFLDTEHNRIIGTQQRVLGVLCRGTDYTLKKPKYHPIQPDPKDMIVKAAEVMEKFNCNKIFLATEDQTAYELFKEHFGDNLLTNDYKKFTTKDLDEVKYISQIENNQQQQQMGYLSSINILSKCCCFIGGRTGGTIGVYLMKEGTFEYDYIWDIGCYE